MKQELEGNETLVLTNLLDDLLLLDGNGREDFHNDPEKNNFNSNVQGNEEEEDWEALVDDEYAPIVLPKLKSIIPPDCINFLNV